VLNNTKTQSRPKLLFLVPAISQNHDFGLEDYITVYIYLLYRYHWSKQLHLLVAVPWPGLLSVAQQHVKTHNNLQHKWWNSWTKNPSDITDRTTLQLNAVRNLSCCVVVETVGEKLKEIKQIKNKIKLKCQHPGNLTTNSSSDFYYNRFLLFGKLSAYHTQ